MFELPDAKRVRREDLYESASEEEDIHDDQLEATLREKLNAQLSGLLGFSIPVDEGNETQQSQPPAVDASGGPDAEAEAGAGAEQRGDEAFTFRLFRDEGPSHTVVLTRQDEAAEGSGNGGFVVAKRPRSYYVAEEPPPRMADQFRVAAVSAEHLFEDAKKRKWGLEKPWKVTTITVTTSKGEEQHPGSTENPGAEASARKTKRRPGKKRRIILRVREETKKEREEAAKQQLVDKEQHLLDKKKRLNRQKKLRRRAKERGKKQDNPGEVASDQSSRESSPEDG